MKKGSYDNNSCYVSFSCTTYHDTYRSQYHNITKYNVNPTKYFNSFLGVHIHMSYFGTTGTSVLDFSWRLSPLGFKVGSEWVQSGFRATSYQGLSFWIMLFWCQMKYKLMWISGLLKRITVAHVCSITTFLHFEVDYNQHFAGLNARVIIDLYRSLSIVKERKGSHSISS